MLAVLNKLCAAYQHFIAALGVLVLLFSAVASLWIALSRNKPKLKAMAYSEYQAGRPENLLWLYIGITNIGKTTAIVNLGYDYIPEYKVFRNNMCLLSSGIQSYPKQIYPKQKTGFAISGIDLFLDAYQKMIKDQPRFNRVFSFCRLKIITTDGTEFAVKVRKDLKRQIAQRLLIKANIDKKL